MQLSALPLPPVGDAAVSPPGTVVAFMSGTSSHTEKLPLCPHAGAVEGLSDEHRFYAYAPHQ